jgi:hypothetical protein
VCWYSAEGLAGPTYALVDSRSPGELSQVKISLDVQGHLKAARRSASKEPDQQVALRVAARLMYDEMLAPRSASPSESADQRPVARYYHQAQAQMAIAAGRESPSLRSDRRVVVAEPDAGELMLFSPDGPLTRQELDLIDVPASSQFVYALLPEQPVAVGQAWQHDGALFKGLARVESISSATIQSKLGKVQGNVARITLGGTLQGRGAGAETEVRISGEYHYDLRKRRIGWLQLLIEEQRSPGHTMPGLQVKADVRMLVTAGGDSSQLRAREWSDLLAMPAQARRMLELTPAPGGFQVTLDRRWHVMSDSSDGVVLRYVDNGDLLAQCNISNLSRLPAGKQVGLEAFQRDVQRAIGQRFGQFEHASQSEDEAGRRLLRVSAVGQVEDVPIRWIYYHISDQQGRCAAHVFTMEGELAERLAGADHTLISGFQFAARQPEAQDQSTASTEPAADAPASPAAPIKTGKRPAARRAPRSRG